MPVDPQIQALLDRATSLPATHTLPVAEARRQMEARTAAMAAPATVGAVAERRMDGPAGPIRLRIYTPASAGPWPLIVFFHGSGFVLCSLDTHDGMCRNLCAGSDCVVVSVDYRLAPEHLADPAGAANPYAAPLKASDLRYLPPAMVQTAEYDPLRDEGELYAARLREAGVPVELSRWDGMNHGFLSWVGVVDRAGETMDEACAWLRRTTAR